MTTCKSSIKKYQRKSNKSACGNRTWRCGFLSTKCKLVHPGVICVTFITRICNERKHYETPIVVHCVFRRTLFSPIPETEPSSSALKPHRSDLVWNNRHRRNRECNFYFSIFAIEESIQLEIDNDRNQISTFVIEDLAMKDILGKHIRRRVSIIHFASS